MAILDARQKKAEDLRRLSEQSASMTEDQLGELRADIKVSLSNATSFVEKHVKCFVVSAKANFCSTLVFIRVIFKLYVASLSLFNLFSHWLFFPCWKYDLSKIVYAHHALV